VLALQLYVPITALPGVLTELTGQQGVGHVVQVGDTAGGELVLITADVAAGVVDSLLPNTAGRDLDPAATPPRCNGGSYHSGLRHRRGSRCDGLSHYRGFRDWMTDDSNSSYTCSSQWHIRLLRSPALHRPRWRR